MDRASAPSQEVGNRCPTGVLPGTGFPGFLRPARRSLGRSEVQRGSLPVSSQWAGGGRVKGVQRGAGRDAVGQVRDDVAGPVRWRLGAGIGNSENGHGAVAADQCAGRRSQLGTEESGPVSGLPDKAKDRADADADDKPCQRAEPG